VVLNSVLTQKSVSKLGRGRTKHQNSRKSIDESDPSQKGQEEEIATPTLCMSPRKGRLEKKEGMYLSDPSEKLLHNAESKKRNEEGMN
jgi:hypothetical protein